MRPIFRQDVQFESDWPGIVLTQQHEIDQLQKATENVLDSEAGENLNKAINPPKLPGVASALHGAPAVDDPNDLKLVAIAVPLNREQFETAQRALEDEIDNHGRYVDYDVPAFLAELTATYRRSLND